jgi:polygalacturonase
MMNKRKIIALVFIVLCELGIKAQWPQTGLPFKMPEINIPVFKPDTFKIENYGAVGDGLTLNTQAFARAIDDCSRKGGGVVLVPSGLWLTGPIILKNNVNLHVAKGALVLFSRNFNHYPMIMSYYEGLETWRCQSPISARRCENIAVTGSGIFDGSGDAWRLVKKSKFTAPQWSVLLNSGGVLNAEKKTWYPSEKSKKGNELNDNNNLPPCSDSAAYANIKDFLRPVMLSLIQCKNILLDGPTFQNSPSWCLHPLLCQHLTIRHVNIRNPWYAQNGDGIDIESCNIGSVDHCTFDAGDDAICIKSGRNEEGRKRGKPTEYFAITNCVVYHGHGGFVIGSEMSGGVRNLYVADCDFLGTDIGLRFKSTRGRGGVVENIYISDIRMINIPAEAIRFDMYYNGTSPIPEGDEKVNKPDDIASLSTINEGTPQFKNFYIRNIYCNGTAQAIFLQGLPEMKIKNVVIENSAFTAVKGITCIDGNNIQMNNVSLEVAKGDVAFIHNSSNISITKLNALYKKGKILKVTGKESQKISISPKKGRISPADIEEGKEVLSGISVGTSE